MNTVEIRKVSSNEQNVSERHISYDIYVGGKYFTTTQDVCDALDIKAQLIAEQQS